MRKAPAMAAASERLLRIEGRRWRLGLELIAPGLLDLWAVVGPELVAQELQALEHRQRLLGCPVRRQGRWGRSAERQGFALAALAAR